MNTELFGGPIGTGLISIARTKQERPQMTKTDTQTGTPDIQTGTAANSKSVAILESANRMADLLLRAASDQTIDVHKLQVLMDLRVKEMEIQERMAAKEAERKYAEDFAAMEGELTAVKKRGYNTMTDSSFAKLEDIDSMLAPLLAAHGFSISYGTYPEPRLDYYGMTARVRHTGGHYEDFRAAVPADVLGPQGKPNKTAMHGFGSSMSYGKRYLKSLIFNLSFEGEDTDGVPRRRQMAPGRQTRPPQDNRGQTRPEQGMYDGPVPPIDDGQFGDIPDCT